MEDNLPDVWTLPVHEAAKNIGALIEFVRSSPGRYVRIVDARQPHRAVWVGSDPPDGWEDDADALAEIHRRNLSRAQRRARSAA